MDISCAMGSKSLRERRGNGMMMHILVHAMQLIGILVPLAGCVALVRRAQSRTPMYLLLANLGCLIMNGSYVLLLQTTTHEGALIALKMEYFGNVVFYLMFGLFLWSYLKLKRHKWTKALLVFWCIMDVAFLACIWVADGYPFVFESLRFVWNGELGLVFARTVPGILYVVRYGTMCVILLCGMAYTTARIFFVQIASERGSLVRLAAAQLVIWVSLILMLVYGFSFDAVPVCASLSILVIIASIFRDEFFGITELGQQWVLEQMEDAFVVVDEMYGYLDSNSYARKVFTELDYKRKNETVSGDMYRLFTGEEKVCQVYGKYYNKKITEIKEKGETAGYSMLLVDVTEQHELMERVREEKERADAANQAKSAFVSNVSHEIRTPMNAIVGMTQIMLRKDDLPKQDREYLMNIKNSGDALLAMINDLLDLSKMESGKMELVEEEYDFMSMLSDLGMILLNRIGNKPVELLFDIDPGIPAKLYGDALRIRQVIINLMNNATKFTESGYVCLTVKVNRMRQKDIELFVSVKDTGQGIREEDIGKLFGSFQQVDAKKNHHKEGTGLGLSISKQLVELMQGSIGVTSEYGKGSEFYFTIRQQVADGRKAARLADGRQAAVMGNMESAAANGMLEKLARDYRLVYAADIRDAKKSGLPVYYFTDRQLSGEERQELTALGAVVCGMCNPMAEDVFPEDMPTLNKPLYSYNFCHFMEEGRNGKGAGPETGGEGNADKEGNPPGRKMPGAKKGITEFTAPEARVLVVDDNEINCMVAEELLRPLQMQVDIASDGRQALERIRKETYDLVFMDHLMPVMDGIEAVKELRKMEGEYYQSLPVIALTGNTAKEQREEYLQAGMNDYLSKPIDMEDICRKIRKWAPDKVWEDG